MFYTSVDTVDNSVKVYGFSVVIDFDSKTPIVARFLDPKCEASSHISNEFGGWGFLPSGCQAEMDCEAILAHLGVFPSEPGLSGRALRCTAEIDPGASHGRYPLTCSSPQASDVDQLPYTTSCTDGAILVIRCLGDCALNGEVTVSDVITGIRLALGMEDPAVCLAWDPDGDGAVAVSDLIEGVNNLLRGCAL